VPAFERVSRDVRMSLARFQDFDHPVVPPSMPGPPVTPSDVRPFWMGVDPTADLESIVRAVELTDYEPAPDWPEAQTEALYQIATGEGLVVDRVTWVRPGPSCPPRHFGYPCFRPGVTPAVLLVTDAPFHEGPDDRFNYAESDDGTPVVPHHSWEETIAALRARQIKVAGLWTGDGVGRRDLQITAEETGAVSIHGEPIVRNVGDFGTEIPREITTAIQQLLDEIPMDVDMELRGDGRRFVTSSGTLDADPPYGARRYEDRFEEVYAGTRIRFLVALENDAVPPRAEPQAFTLRILLWADGEERLRTVRLRLVVPGLDGAGCDDV